MIWTTKEINQVIRLRKAGSQYPDAPQFEVLGDEEKLPF